MHKALMFEAYIYTYITTVSSSINIDTFHNINNKESTLDHLSVYVSIIKDLTKFVSSGKA